MKENFDITVLLEEDNTILDNTSPLNEDKEEPKETNPTPIVYSDEDKEFLALFSRVDFSYSNIFKLLSNIYTDGDGKEHTTLMNYAFVVGTNKPELKLK